MSMVGRSLEEYIHPRDLPTVRRLLKVCHQIKTAGEEYVAPEWRTQKRILYIAMRVCLQDRYSSCPKELDYTLVEWNIRLDYNNGPGASRLVALCRLVVPGPPVTCRLEADMFTSRHDLSFRFTSCDHRLVNLTGYEPEELFGWAPYHFISPWDAAIYKQCVQALTSQGASISRGYRFLSKSGVWVGMVTQASVVYDTRCRPRYIVCKNHIVRDERIQQKPNKEKEDFLKMKCLSFCVEDELSVVNHLKSSQSSTTNKQNLSKLESDLFLKQFFDSDQSSNLVSLWHSSKIQEQITVPRPDVTTVLPSTEQFFTMAVDSSQNVGRETIVNAISDYHISKNKLPLSSGNKGMQYEESTHAPQTEAAQESTTSICEVDMLDTGVDSCQELTSQLTLPLENIVDTVSFNQVLECCNPVDQCLLSDAFPEPSWIQMEASDFGNVNMADYESVSHQRNAGSKYSETAGDTEYQADQNECTDNRQGRQALNAHSALESAQQFSYKLNGLCLSQTPWMLCNLTHESILSPTGGNLQKISENACLKSDPQTRDTSRNIFSGKLASHLHLGSAPPSSSASTLKREFVRHASDYSQDEKNALSNACAHTNFCSTSSYQHNKGEPECFETDFSSDSMWCARQTSPIGNIPSSDSMWCAQPTSPAGNIPSSVSKLPILNHEFLSSSSCGVSACEIHQGNSNMQYSSHSDSENPSLSDATLIFSESDNINDLNSFFSIMTNRKCDPFLNQTSFKNLNPLTYVDQTDDVDSPKSSVNAHLAMSQTSQMEHGKQSDFEIEEINHSDFSSTPDFVASGSSCMSDVQFVSECFDAASLGSQRVDELDTFLYNISSDTCSTTNCNRTANCQTMLFTENIDSHLALESPLSCGSNNSSDSDTLGPTSLLRTLLDKEEQSVQGPLTYAEWIFEQALKEKCDIKKTKISYLKSEIKHADNKRARNSRCIYRKSVDMPLPISSHGVKINVTKSKLPHKKPTKELPLPVSAKIITQQPFLPSQENNNTESVPQTNNGVNNNITEKNGFDLPDDLLDMAMEYCASMETDQEDGLITDLTDHFLSEDHFNSLCGSPPQDLKSGCSSNTHNKPGRLILSQPYSVSSSSKERNAESSANEMPMHVLESQYLNQGPVSNLTSRSSQNCRNTENNVKTPRNSQTSSTIWGTKMSLLRTAVMTPDVDKLIEHIPLGNSYKYSVNNNDILVPKSAKLQEHSIPPSAQVSHGNLCKMSSVNTIKSPDTSSLLHPHKNFYKHSNTSDDKPTLGYVCKTSLSKDSVTPRQKLSHCLSTTSANGSPKPKSGPSGFVLKISIHQDCSSTVTNSNKTFENSINQKFKHTTSHTTARAAGVSVSDSSATQPVSVIIMRKENNRSRRSKSRAVQTDNDPGEKFPEFEHSPSDTFLYPSVIVCSPSSTTSEECDMSTSTSQLSPTLSSLSSLSSSSKSSLANMSELEQLICRGCDSSSSLKHEDFQTLPNASFLQRLLMGQLSKDQYQHLDKQMMEAEKRVMISSAVL